MEYLRTRGPAPSAILATPQPIRMYRLAPLLLLIALLTACGNTDAVEREASQDRPPNIIFIMSDDHAYQAISAYDDRLIETPNIDRLAEEGMLFSNACVTNSICAPSTGRNPDRQAQPP